jgi:hypothetical protein
MLGRDEDNNLSSCQKIKKINTGGLTNNWHTDVGEERDVHFDELAASSFCRWHLTGTVTSKLGYSCRNQAGVVSNP